MKDKTNNWWAEIFPEGVSIGSPMGSNYRLYDYFIPEITQGLYKLLKNAPPFRFAIAGHEVEFFVYYEDLEKEIQEEYWEGLIISEKIWRIFNEPENFTSFSEGYMWHPYLESSDTGQKYWFGKYELLKEFKVNEGIILRLENGDSNIFVNDKLILQCRYLLTNQLKESKKKPDVFGSVDEFEDFYEDTSEVFIQEGEFPPLDRETEFWGHCSNIQAWAENDYNTRLLDKVLAFPILKELNKAGDTIASKVFKVEVKKRIRSGYLPVILYLIEGGYLKDLKKDELNEIIENIELLIKKIPTGEQDRAKEQISEVFRYSTYLREETIDRHLKIKTLDIALRFNPQNNYALYETGLSYFFLSNYERAEECFKKH